MPIQHDEGVLGERSVPGPALYFTTARPASGQKATVGLIHGYADHAARYAHVMDAWAERGIATVAIDLRGHGRAAGPRGYCSRFDEFLDDASELTRLVDAKANGGPTFLFGHSFGGLVASSSVLAAPHHWRGLILSGPYFDLAMAVPPVKILAAKVASRVFPKLGMPSGLSGKDVTHDAARARAYDEDPLVFKDARARWFVEAKKAQASAMSRAGQLRLPLYLGFGGADSIAKLGAARTFFDAAGSTDKTWDERPGLFHEILNEPSWREIATAMADWILARA